ncbi:MAG: Dolichyl-phosphate-mannose-protein mannosyltransferase family protein [uncultured bacterium]|nr:MAG: Dolichyl-phosphate-mannose-protein mannosyltransferase family protein [uncultured bacterium]
MCPNKIKSLQAYSWWTDSLILIIACSGLFFILLGTRPLFVPDEGRYAEIAREMFVRNDFITPYLNGIKYFEKPALFYWLGALAIKMGGVNIWSLRCINALFATAGALLTYLTIRKIYDRITGLIAASVLSTSLLYFTMARMVSLDLPVTFFLMSCLYSFLLAIHEANAAKQRSLFWLAAASAGLAVLTKGLIGIVFPLLIISTWIMILGEWRLIKKLPIFSSIAIFLLITAPWHLLVSLKNPEFFYFYFIEQHFLRYTTKEVGHYQPVWFFIPVLFLSFFPWIVFLPQAIKKSFAWTDRKNYQTEIFLLLWASLIFLFFSFSKSKLIPYILPVIPPLAILTARYLAVANTIKNRLAIRISYIILLIFACGVSFILYSFTHNNALPDAHQAKLYFDIASIILQTGIFFAAVFSFENLIASLIISIITIYIFLLTLTAGIPAIDNRTILPLAHTLQSILKPNDEVITFNQYYQDLPFYLERRITILNWRNEMSYGMQHQDTSDWMINDTTFWNRWHSAKQVYVILSQDEYLKLRKRYPNKKFYVLDQTITNILITNHAEQ